MKQIIFTVILILAFSVAAFAQEEMPEFRCGVPFDSFGKLHQYDLYARLDNFFVALLNDPTAKGFVKLKLNKNENKARKIKQLNEISKHLSARKFDRTRITFAIFEVDEKYTTLYVAPQQASIKDVVFENENYKVIKGEEFDQKIKELFPKK